MKISSSTVLFSLAGLVVLGLIVFVIVQGKATATYRPFAECLTEKGVKMYGAWWCPHCQAQKKLFGSAFSSVDYTECSPPGDRSMLPVCREAGIESFPTWVFPDGTRKTGEQSFTDLAAASQCELPTDSASQP